MTLHGLSDAFLAAVRTNHTVARQVLVRAPNGDVSDITEFIDGGSVSVDETREYRRTCTLTPNGDPDLVPDDAADLLHPMSGNELVIKRGVKYPDGTTEMAQLGVFRLTKPAFDDNGAITATLNGNDRASFVSQIDWQAPYVVRAGGNIAAALAAAMETRMPGLDYSGFDESIDFSYPDTTWGQTPSQAGDPMQDFITFAAQGGAECFFDISGNPILRAIVNPLTSLVVDDISFVEGPQVAGMNQVGRTIDETTGKNGVILYCNGVGVTPPFRIEVWDIDPSSPSYYLGKWGQRPYKMTTTAIPSGADTFVQAQAKGLTAANGQLQLVLGAANDITASIAPNPALREGDCVAVKRSRLKVGGDYVLSNFTVPLDVASPMPVGFRPRVQAA